MRGLTLMEYFPHANGEEAVILEELRKGDAIFDATTFRAIMRCAMRSTATPEPLIWSDSPIICGVRSTAGQ